MEIFYLFLLFEVGHGHRLIRDVTMFGERRSSDERNSDEGRWTQVGEAVRQKIFYNRTNSVESRDGLNNEIVNNSYISFGHLPSEILTNGKKDENEGEAVKFGQSIKPSDYLRKASRNRDPWHEDYSSSNDRKSWREDVPFQSRPIPNQIGGITGFSSVRASRESQEGRKGRIVLENTFTNLNLGWSPQDSIFRCVDPGLYSFSFTARGVYSQGNNYFPEQPSSLDGFNDLGGPQDIIIEARLRGRSAIMDDCFTWIVSLMLNGQAVVSAGGANDTSASNTILLPLNKDDRVWLQLTRGQLVEIGYDKGGLTTFSGYRIGEILPSDISSTSRDFREQNRSYQRESAKRFRTFRDDFDFDRAQSEPRDGSWIAGLTVEPSYDPFGDTQFQQRPFGQPYF